MFGSVILDLAIGLMFTFLVISLITSAATEAAASALRWRANTLLDGVKALLNDPQFNGLALDIYNHDLVNPRADGTAGSQQELKAKPSYINPQQFASALLDVAGLSPGSDVQTLQNKINTTITDGQLKTMLNGCVARAGRNLNRVNDEIAAWFDNGMDRVSGVYKRKTQLWSFFIALGIAIVLNVDTITIAESLWKEPMLMKQLPQLPAGETAAQAWTQFNDLRLPFGWRRDLSNELLKFPNWLLIPFGWLITAVATLFGAPFWFDTLQRFVQLRGAGSDNTNSSN
jgi:hypothetical protein